MPDLKQVREIKTKSVVKYTFKISKTIIFLGFQKIDNLCYCLKRGLFALVFVKNLSEQVQ